MDARMCREMAVPMNLGEPHAIGFHGETTAGASRAVGDKVSRGRHAAARTTTQYAVNNNERLRPFEGQNPGDGHVLSRCPVGTHQRVQRAQRASTCATTASCRKRAKMCNRMAVVRVRVCAGRVTTRRDVLGGVGPKPGANLLARDTEVRATSSGEDPTMATGVLGRNAARRTWSIAVLRVWRRRDRNAARRDELSLERQDN
ncbi:hypothetical protein PUNSTDRAFT_43815 [Punctularia strigosozonata HHB-11173 SS5]|uniref:uncharacterized protein n=1 Tax=Punctularia strigosozonata (strain HHB-11173) TaxID=741275 RepID=UPI0004416419|nr:uncharacterized protein PUNSTDRAFT_43815 [Punctularia strigosozonata HHB-11173 SS5]EIN09414.1 hypothetical protein PUNSTDRAFT_43815 [Punctularia strigosozonata HHB-11173 SS5]